MAPGNRLYAANQVIDIGGIGNCLVASVAGKFLLHTSPCLGVYSPNTIPEPHRYGLMHDAPAPKVNSDDSDYQRSAHGRPNARRSSYENPVEKGRQSD